jgi:hypothetical protein
VSELGNLTERIFLSPRRMSTVKIRARSPFRTPRSRFRAKEAEFGRETVGARPTRLAWGCKVRRYNSGKH